MIQKKIHYIWLGNKPMDKTSIMCINSCRRACPDYEIKIWDEKELNLKQISKNNKFLDICLKLKLWAFASDYLRLYILSKEGGIYLDTDVEVIKNFDSMLDEVFFVGREMGDYIGTGIIGADKNSKILKSLIEFYDQEIWNVDYYNNPIIFKNVIFDEKNSNFDYKIFPVNYFSPYNPYKKLNKDIIGNQDTVCIHWYNANWGISRKGYVFLNTKHIKKPLNKIVQIIRKNLGYLKRKFDI